MFNIVYEIEIYLDFWEIPIFCRLLAENALNLTFLSIFYFQKSLLYHCVRHIHNPIIIMFSKYLLPKRKFYKSQDSVEAVN